MFFQFPIENDFLQKIEKSGEQDCDKGLFFLFF